MAKSFASTLVGVAIDEGYIKSVDESITNYEAAPIGGQLFAHNHSQRDCTAF